MISPDFIPVWSGIGAYTVSLLENIPKDVQIHLLTVKREIPHTSLRKSALQANEKVLKAIGKKVNIHYVSYARNTFSYNLNFQLACMKAVPKICEEHKIDLIHANFPLMSDIFVKLIRRIRIPSVATIQSTIDGQHFGVKNARTSIANLEQSDIANLLLYRPLRILELLYAWKTPYYIAISESIKREFTQFLGVEEHRIETIYHGVDTNFFDAEREKDYPFDTSRFENGPTVTFTGRFVATKGLNTLVEAIPRVLRAFPNATFVFVGGGNFEPYFHYLKSLGVSKQNIIVLGYLNFFEMPAVYAKSTICVVPTTYEPLGIRVMEAMSCERPVIASEVGGIPEIITNGHDGILVPPRESEALADSILKLLNNPSLAKRLGENGRRTIVQRFSVQKMVKETIDFFKKVAK